MATASSLLSEDRFLCPVCLDVFTEPVSTPCGHNFCSACIHTYWAGGVTCQCPLCKSTFPQRPELQVNKLLSELAADFQTLVQVKASTPDPQRPGSADVLCDICSETKENAVKSCLTCLVSFCEVHLEPHQRVAGLKGHTLLDPVKNLDDRMCKAHSKMTELYCRTDQAFVCILCISTHHKGHNVVPLEEEYEATMAKKGEAMASIQEMTRARNEKIEESEKAVDVRRTEAEKEKEASVQVFTDLIRSIQRSQAELVGVIDERYRDMKQKADDLIRELRVEVTELESRSRQLEQLSQSKDHHYFLQSFPALCCPLNATWAHVGGHSDPSFEAARGAVTLLQLRVEEIMEELPEIKMKRMREHAVDLTFDPDTAHCSLVVSSDGKQVSHLGTNQNLPHNPKRFETCTEVLAKEGFTTGKFYYEVQVEGNTEWLVGVARESVDRKGDESLSEKYGAWYIGIDEGICRAYTSKSVELTLKDTLRKVGIFVDYNKGEVSFFDANSKLHIYSFTGHHFTEKLYPYFSLQGNTDGAPLIITPVPQTH
ncbi:E3 ubiquitin-protein ligase TRIM39-like [Pseudoliparis swirei]|uniref:E3 ubiquitin-protein ligase TRIM39-like n=1 Tax=Pseudoliparis swirei TaxID=2059687 RepID=UPI0024BE1F16|nr:E3 ubiquitin-protein ligase TRIM39-like [Pseudoliparis swirei]